MPVVQEQVSPCEVSLQIDVEKDKVAKAVDQAYKEFSQFITVPGFRKGKAPMSFVRQRVPQSQLRERTAELLVEPAYQDAIAEKDLKPFASPKLELLSLETAPPEQAFRFKAVIPLPPVVEVGTYVGVEVERLRYEITDESVESRIQAIRDRAAEYPEITDRAAQVGDLVVMTLAITPQGGEAEAPRSTTLLLGDPNNVPGLDDQLIGLSPGDAKVFTLTFPGDYPSEDVAGQDAEFDITVDELRLKQSPELDDEFAKKYGSVDTMDEFRKKLRADLEKTMVNLAQQRMEAMLVDTIVANSTIEYPTMLRDNEVNGEAQEFLADLQRRGADLDTYLEQTGQTQSTLLSEFEQRADLRIRRGLVLEEIARRENLLLTDEDVKAEIAARAAAQRATPEAMRAYLEANKQMNQVTNAAQTKKILGFLTASAIIKDKVIHPGDEEAAQAVEAAAPAEVEKPKRAKKKKSENAETEAGE